MTIHFAAARTANASVLARVLRVPAARRPANDDPQRDLADAVLDRTLRHFARHGLAAAAEAERALLRAAAAGDTASEAQWREICAMLDPRRARGAGRKRTAATARTDRG